MGNVKHSSCALLTAFIPCLSPFISLSRLQIKEQLSGCAAVTVLKGREGRGCREQPRCIGPQHGPTERSRCRRGARRRDEHLGLCHVLAHESPCDGTERASASSHLRAGHAVVTGSGTGFRQEQVGHRMRSGTGSSAHGEGRYSCCCRRLDSFGRKNLAKPAQTKAGGTRHGSGSQGFRSFLSMQFFLSCKQGLQQAKQIRGCNVILDICSLEN